MEEFPLDELKTENLIEGLQILSGYVDAKSPVLTTPNGVWVLVDSPVPDESREQLRKLGFHLLDYPAAGRCAASEGACNAQPEDTFPHNWKYHPRHL